MENDLLAEELKIRDDIVRLFESTKRNDKRLHRLFLEQWQPLSDRLDEVILELVKIEDQQR
ncbi:MAG: hypothetical protein NTY60_09775 [Proteobacteria bacterium]|nr:hypothetical protein [Pseudomonadota bacterium]